MTWFLDDVYKRKIAEIEDYNPTSQNHNLQAIYVHISCPSQIKMQFKCLAYTSILYNMLLLANNNYGSHS